MGQEWRGEAFAGWLRQRRLFADHQVPHVVRWVGRYLRGREGESDGLWQDGLRVFLEALAEGRTPDWQIRQAADAVTLYFTPALLVAVVWAGFDWYSYGTPLAHWGWLGAVFFVFFGAGFDIAGILLPRTSDAERMMQRLGFRQLGSLFVETEGGRVRLERTARGGCLICTKICPIGVFAGLDAGNKVAFEDQGACFACGACVKQCPDGALSLDDT